MLQGHIHSTESFGSVDGPGIRFIIFLQGCRMRCRYCHNPDTWSAEGGTTATADELLDKAERFRTYWGKDGGITVSGGEPLLQIDFVTELFRKAHERGIHTCLDTCAQPFQMMPEYLATFDELLRYTDLVMLDIKHIDTDAHLRLTGHPNASILQAARYLSDHQQPMWIRHVLVPGLTDEDEQLIRLRQFIDELSSVERVEVLPYHVLALAKWEALGIPYTLQDVEPPTKEQVEHARQLLRC